MDEIEVAYCNVLKTFPVYKLLWLEDGFNIYLPSRLRKSERINALINFLFRKTTYSCDPKNTIYWAKSDMLKEANKICLEYLYYRTRDWWHHGEITEINAEQFTILDAVENVDEHLIYLIKTAGYNGSFFHDLFTKLPHSSHKRNFMMTLLCNIIKKSADEASRYTSCARSRERFTRLHKKYHATDAFKKYTRTKYDEYVAELFVWFKPLTKTQKAKQRKLLLNYLLNKHAYENINPSFKFNMVEKLTFDSCSICLEEDCTGGLMPSCKHIFHKKCLQTWLTNNKTCPICRIQIIL